MIKCFFLFFLLSVPALNATQPHVLQRLNIERISKYTVQYQKELKRLSLKRKLVYGVGAGVAIGVAWWVWLHWLNPAKVKVSGYIIEDKKEQVGWFKQAFKWAWAGVFYSFMFSEITAFKNIFFEKMWPQGLNFLESLSSNGKVKVCEHLVNTRGKSIAAIVLDYERSVKRALDLGCNDQISLSFVAFLERQIVHQNDGLVRALEEVLACLYALQIYEYKDNKEIVQELDERMHEFMSVIDVSSSQLEIMLNAPIDKNKLDLCKNGLLICNEVSLYAQKFAEDCRSCLIKVDS